MLVNASDLDTSPPEYVVEGMLPDFGVGFGYGDSYTGKTLALAIELCLAIANGVPYFGHETIQGGAVWCLGEGLADAGVRIKARLVREHTDRMTQAAQIEQEQGAEAAAAWLAQQPAYTDDRMKVKIGGFPVPFLASTLGPGEELRQAVTELSLIPDLRLVVLDTARRYTSNSLSNGTTANRFMQGMSWLAAQLQCTVMAIGHPVSKGRGETGLPGDTLFGSSDFVWRIRAGEDSTDDTPNALITAEKVKSGPLFKPVGYELERIRWQQPPTDPETGEDIPDVPLITVSSVTVRQRMGESEQPAALPVPRRTAGPLPLGEMVAPGRAVRRTGLRPRPPAFRAVGQSSVPVAAGRPPADLLPAALAAAGLRLPGLLDDEPGTVPLWPESLPGPDADEDERAARIAALISGTCPECQARPGTSCLPDNHTTYVIIGKMPLVLAHVARLNERVAHGAVDLDDVLAQFPVGGVPAELAGAPA